MDRELSHQHEPAPDIIEIPSGEDKRHEPIIKDKGVPVWILVAYNKRRDMSSQQISEMWDGFITPEEVQASLEFAQAHPELVIDKLLDSQATVDKANSDLI